MSWDAIIAKTADPNYAKPAENAAFLSMGTVKDVRAKVNAAVPQIKWSNGQEGVAFIGSLSLEINLAGKSDGTTAATAKRLSDHDEVESIGVSARGDGDPVATLVSLAKENHWSVSDSQEGTWIDLNSAGQNSWQGFTTFRDKALSDGRGGGSGNPPSVATNLMISAGLLIVAILVIRAFSKRSVNR